MKIDLTSPRIAGAFIAALVLGSIAALAQPTSTAPDFTSIKGKILSSQNFKAINAQVGTTYTVLDSDRGKLVTLTNASAIAVTLPQAGAASSFITGWWGDFYVNGAGTATITPTTSSINGTTSLALTAGQSAHCVSNGTNYFCELGKSAGGGSGTVTSAVIAAGTGISVSGTCTITTTGTCTVANTGVTSVAGAGLATGTVTTTGSITVTAATQADQETSTSTTTAVTPGRQQFHPSAAKAWAVWTTSAGVATLQASYNASLVRNGAGDYTITFTTAMSGATAYMVNCAAGTPGSTLGFPLGISGGKVAGSYRIGTYTNAVVLTDFTENQCVFFGDQ